MAFPPPNCISCGRPTVLSHESTFYCGPCKVYEFAAKPPEEDGLIVDAELPPQRKK